MNRIAEQLAEKEMEIDPRRFIHRETIARTMSKAQRKNITDQDDKSVFYSFKDTHSKVDASDLEAYSDSLGIAVKPSLVGNSNSEPSPNRARLPQAQPPIAARLGDVEVMSEQSRPMVTAFDDKSSYNCDAIDEDLSSVSHGLANKMLPTTG